MTTYRIEHRSSHAGELHEGSTYLRCLLTPRDGGGQQLLEHQLTMSPQPVEQADYRDFDANLVTHLEVPAPHEQIELTATSVVAVTRRSVRPAHLPQTPWEQVVAAARQMRATGQGQHGEGPAAVTSVVEGCHPSELVPAPDDNALRFLQPGVPLVALVAGIAAQMSQGMGRAAQSVGVDRALAEGVGSTQDLAHAMCALLRGVGLSARYVAGYRYEPGVDGAHAWTAAWLPGGGWLHIDPAAGDFVDDRYVVLGWGRDALDASPVRGVRLAGGGSYDRTDEVRLTPVADQASGRRR